MKVFFGKISNKVNPDQHRNGFYETDTPTMFNGIEIGDYCFLIANGKIQLWKAREWHNDNKRLDFDILIKDTGMNTKKLTALKFFKIKKDFVVITVRSAVNAFFEIGLTGNITPAQLSDESTYQNEDNFRKIIIYDNQEACQNSSKDVQLFLKNNIIHIFKADFIEADAFNNFYDNRDKIGKGRKNKDSTLKKFQAINSFPHTFSASEVSLLNLYDAFAVKYDEKSIFEEIDEELSVEYLEKEKMSKSASLNQILYGPPGTGKTFHTINKAIEIIEPDFDLTQERKKVKEKFDELRQSGRIVFTTFHQSMTYEDFVEGIKPQEPINEQSPVTYKLEPGIFKLICENARQVKELKTQNASIFKDVRFYKMSLGGLNRPDIYEWCLENNCLALGWGNDVNFKSYKDISDWVSYRDKFISENPELSKESSFNITAMYAFQNMRAGDIVAISKGNNIIDAIGRVEGEYYWGDHSPFGYFQFRKIEWLAKNINQDPQLFFNKKISQQSIYQFYDVDVKKDAFIQFFALPKVDNSKVQPHVLIIDEINRGNVSQIFGELITLLETDKRMGNDEALEVKLAYSKDLFSIPPNLYLIGTMNTADRSVEALDTALRRRFSFVEMPPKEDLLTPSAIYWRLLKQYGEVPWKNEVYLKKEAQLFKLLGAGEFVHNNKEDYWKKFEKDQKTEKPFPEHHFSGIRLDLLLRDLNRRIEKLLDKDHLIGHSYFLKVSSIGDLQDTFYRNIIPLLQEYFFGDFGKIGLVLGAGFVQKEESRGDFAEFSDYTDMAELDERPVFRIKKEGEWEEGEFESALNILLKKSK